MRKKMRRKRVTGTVMIINKIENPQYGGFFYLVKTGLYL